MHETGRSKSKATFEQRAERRKRAQRKRDQEWRKVRDQIVSDVESEPWCWDLIPD